MNELRQTPADRLLSVWQAALASGLEMPVAELCREHPELRAEVESKIAAIRHIQQLAPPAPPPDDLVTLSVDDTTITPEGIPEAPAQPLFAESVDCYRLVRILGQGGMGTVWEAEDTRLRRPVALKMMLPALLANEKARERFLREARAQAAIHHEHVAVIHAVGEQGGVPYIVMPLLRGSTLADRLTVEPGLDFDGVLRLGREMAEGLAAAHDRGLIHRDIKPANIWLEGPAERVRLLDFGLARTTGSTVDATITASGVVLGTPAYMAPEQAGGEKVDARADLFSLGVVLYEMSTGRRPFAGNSTFSVLAALASHDPPAPSAVRPAIPRVLSDLIEGLLIKDPELRQPQSARELVERFKMIEAGQEPPRRVRRVAPEPKAKRWPLVAGGALIALLVLAVGYQVRNATFAGTDAVTDTTQPAARDPFEVAVGKLKTLLPQLRKQTLVNDFQDTGSNGILGFERKEYHRFRGLTGEIVSLKATDKETVLLRIEYTGKYDRECFDLGVLAAREKNEIGGSLEFTLVFQVDHFEILDIQQQSSDSATSPIDQGSHQRAKVAVVELLIKILAEAR